jgi:hypothetical protein
MAEETAVQAASAELLKEVKEMLRDAREELPGALVQIPRKAAQQHMNSVILDATFGGLFLVLWAVVFSLFHKNQKKAAERPTQDCYHNTEENYVIGKIVSSIIAGLVTLILAGYALSHALDAKTIQDNPKAYILERFIERK